MEPQLVTVLEARRVTVLQAYLVPVAWIRPRSLYPYPVSGSDNGAQHTAAHLGSTFLLASAQRAKPGTSSNHCPVCGLRPDLRKAATSTSAQPSISSMVRMRGLAPRSTSSSAVSPSLARCEAAAVLLPPPLGRVW